MIFFFSFSLFFFFGWRGLGYLALLSSGDFFLVMGLLGMRCRPDLVFNVGGPADWNSETRSRYLSG